VGVPNFVKWYREYTGRRIASGAHGPSPLTIIPEIIHLCSRP
jgi:hypothetical protein